MKSIKIALLSVIFMIGFILPSCKKDIDSCGGSSLESSRYFNIKGLNAFVYQNNDNGFEVISSKDTLPFLETTGIYLIYQAEYHSLNLPAFNNSFSLLSTAMACTPIQPGYDGSKTERLENLTITTLNDFDEEHPANSSINDFFEVQTSVFQGEDIPLTEFLQNQTENIKTQELLLKLKQVPTATPTFHFKISIELSTGEKYETEGVPIYFEED